MTFQEKQAYIQNAIGRVDRGLSWPVLENELRNTPGLYQKDVDDIARKVLVGVEQIHGDRIQAHLMANQTEISPDNLHPTVFSLIRGRQEEIVRNILKNRIARDLAKGVPPAQALTQHQNHLLSKEDYDRAVQKARNRLQAQAEDNDSGWGVAKVVIWIVLFIVITAIKLAIRG